MSSGPIDFGEEEERATGYSTEFGGVDGLIQPEEIAGEEAHSVLTESEKTNIASRRGSHMLSSHEAWTGEPDEVEITDPVTGRVLDPSDLEDVTDVGNHAGELSALKPHDLPDV